MAPKIVQVHMLKPARITEENHLDGYVNAGEIVGVYEHIAADWVTVGVAEYVSAADDPRPAKVAKAG